MISREHGALTLRALRTLAEVAAEHNSMLVIPIPLDLLDAVREHVIKAETPALASVNTAERAAR